MASSAGRALEARKLSLPKPLHNQSPHISALFYDPYSLTLALRHSDSSFSLYPNFTPLSAPNFPTPQPLIPSPTSSAAFLHLRTTTADSAATTVFLTSSPLLRPSSTLLRFHILRVDQFTRIRVVSSHKDLEFDREKAGMVFKVNHGVSMKLCAGINVFSMYSVSNSKIWVFGVRLVRDDGGGEALKLIKCAVIDCCFPVFEIRILFGFLVLGEEDGVRFFPLMPLVKGKNRKKNGSKRVLSNGVVAKDSKFSSVKGEKNERHSGSVKLKSVKLRQDSKDTAAFFVAFTDKESSISIPGKSVKAISIQALSAYKFVILDSLGDVHLMCISNSVNRSYPTQTMQQLTQTMKVLKLAVFHDVSAETRAIWMSDGSHTVHLTMVSDSDTSGNDTEKKDSEGELTQTSVTQVIFMGERIQDIVPLAAEAILILGQGSLLAYSIS